VLVVFDGCNHHHTAILVWSQTHVDIGKSNTVPAISLNILDMINGTVDSGHKETKTNFTNISIPCQPKQSIFCHFIKIVITKKM
jgi:hypothetical protein